MISNRIRTAATLPVITVLFFVFLTGCSTPYGTGKQVLSPPSDIEGRWHWKQDHPWEGYFALTQKGDLYIGTLGDLYAGIYENKIMDVNVTNDNIKFTRYGKHGVQYWQGTLDRSEDQLRIVDGQWGDGSEILGSFSAEKISDNGSTGLKQIHCTIKPGMEYAVFKKMLLDAGAVEYDAIHSSDTESLDHYHTFFRLPDRRDFTIKVHSDTEKVVCIYKKETNTESPYYNSHLQTEDIPLTY